MVTEGVPDCESDGVTTLGVRLGLTVRLGDALLLGVCVCDWEGVDVPVAVTEGVSVFEAVREGVVVPDGVVLAVVDGDGVGLCVAPCVALAEPLRVPLDEPVPRWLCVGDGVTLADGVDVDVDVTDAVCVSDCDAVGRCDRVADSVPETLIEGVALPEAD